MTLPALAADLPAALQAARFAAGTLAVYRVAPDRFEVRVGPAAPRDGEAVMAVRNGSGAQPKGETNRRIMDGRNT